jgi:hypothetical protein
MSKKEKYSNMSQDIIDAPQADLTGNLSDEDLDKVAGGGEPIMINGHVICSRSLSRNGSFSTGGGVGAGK